MCKRSIKAARSGNGQAREKLYITNIALRQCSQIQKAFWYSNETNFLLFLPPLVEPSDALAAFFVVGFFLARCSFNFSALSRYCAHFPRILSFALSLWASSVKRDSQNHI